MWWNLDLFAPFADAEGQPLWQHCTDTPKGATNAEWGKRYECNAPCAPVYAKASENKGPPVKTLEWHQCIEAKELRSDDGRRWLRYTDDRGQRKPLLLVTCLLFVVMNIDCILASRTVYALGGRRRETAMDASRPKAYGKGRYSAGDHTTDD